MKNHRQQLDFCLPHDVSADEFLRNYWQKQPLLIRGGLTSLANYLKPQDVLELATFEEVTARLITQDDANPNNWHIFHSPLAEGALANTPTLWTLLVQNLEQWSVDIAEQWAAFAFLPQWLRDDIMVSYAPKGGSVGKHYDRYDVFLVQGYGERRWQLGKFCNEKTPILQNQPLRLIKDMGDIVFDDVLSAGDVLYVPPFLSHYGVAQNDCLTYSFGLRSPSNIELLDTLVDTLSAQAGSVSFWQAPCVETLSYGANSVEKGGIGNKNTASDTQGFYGNDEFASTEGIVKHGRANGQINQTQLQALKQQLILAINNTPNDVFADAIATALSQRRFSFIKEDNDMDMDGILEDLADGAVILKEPAVKLIYTLDQHKQKDPLELYCQGEHLDGLYPNQKWLLKKLADGDRLGIEDLEGFDVDVVCDWVNNGWVTLKH